MRKLIFNVPDETSRKRVLKDAEILKCEIEVYIDHSLTEYHPKEREDPKLNELFIYGV